MGAAAAGVGPTAVGPGAVALLVGAGSVRVAGGTGVPVGAGVVGIGIAVGVAGAVLALAQANSRLTQRRRTTGPARRFGPVILFIRPLANRQCIADIGTPAHRLQEGPWDRQCIPDITTGGSACSLIITNDDHTHLSRRVPEEPTAFTVLLRCPTAGIAGAAARVTCMHCSTRSLTFH